MPNNTLFFFDESVLSRFLIISPSYRCNLSCKGCYSKNRYKDYVLDIKRLDKLITDSENSGISFFIISGGEPLMIDRLDKVVKNHENSFFWIFTNGTLFDNIQREKFSNIYNVFFFFSVEGPERQTDFRRGDGVYKKILGAMETAHSSEIPFGFSCIVADYNVMHIDNDFFIDEMIESGCKGGIYLEYKDYFNGTEGIKKCCPEKKAEFEKNILAKNFEKNIWFLYMESIEKALGGCQGGKRFFHIDPRLNITICPMVENSGEIDVCDMEKIKNAIL